jgi:hypothetical protein
MAALRPPSASIDAIDILTLEDGDDRANPHTGDVLVIRGWAHQPGATPVFSVVVDQTAEHPLEVGINRPDVAASLNDPKAADSGFSASVPTFGLADGEHAIAIVASANGTRQEVARARFQLSAAVSLANLEQGRGCIDSWTDEEGRSELIRGTPVRVPRNQVVRLDGWIADTVAQSPAIAAFALIGEHVVQVAYGFERLDVASELGEHHAYSGFSAAFPGHYASRDGTPVRLVMLAFDGTTLRAGEPTITLVGYD